MKRSDNSNNHGFTLMEVTVSVGITAVIGFLMLTVVNSINAAVDLSQTKDSVQASVRDTLTAMTTELEQASKKTNTALTPALAALAVPTTTSVVFQVPTDNLGQTFSQPITYTLVNEDTNRNGRMDTGEDANNDRVLTRCIRRTQAGVSRTLGAANDVANVQFALNATGDVLTITVTGSRAINNRRHDLITATASSSVYLHN